MNICVIGGSGFVGSRLVPELARHARVTIFDKQPSPFFPELTFIIDIRNKLQLESSLKEFDLVIHLAAEHKDDVTPISLYYDVNVTGTKNILDAMVLNNIHRIIFFSSVAVYGINKPNPDEKYSTNPFNHYGKSKLQAENEILKWLSTEKEGHAIVVRPTVIFGERNRGNVYNLLNQIASKKFLMIGNGHNMKSMAYVENVVAFTNYCIKIKTSNFEVFNYIDKPDLTMNEFVTIAQKCLNKKIHSYRIPHWLGYLGGIGFDFIARITGKKFSVSAVRVKKFCATTQFDGTKASISGFKAPFTLENGLQKTIQFEFLDKKNERILFYSE